MLIQVKTRWLCWACNLPVSASQTLFNAIAFVDLGHAGFADSAYSLQAADALDAAALGNSPLISASTGTPFALGSPDVYNAIR